MTTKDLGRWESLEMVQRYTKSVTFEDSIKHYSAVMGGLSVEVVQCTYICCKFLSIIPRKIDAVGYNSAGNR